MMRPFCINQSPQYPTLAHLIKIFCKVLEVTTRWGNNPKMRTWWQNITTMVWIERKKDERTPFVSLFSTKPTLNARSRWLQASKNETKVQIKQSCLPNPVKEKAKTTSLLSRADFSPTEFV
jgi:hypothetical protein